jgi:hypothetical protein
VLAVFLATLVLAFMSMFAFSTLLAPLLLAAAFGAPLATLATLATELLVMAFTVLRHQRNAHRNTSASPAVDRARGADGRTSEPATEPVGLVCWSLLTMVFH